MESRRRYETVMEVGAGEQFGLDLPPRFLRGVLPGGAGAVRFAAALPSGSIEPTYHDALPRRASQSDN